MSYKVMPAREAPSVLAPMRHRPLPTCSNVSLCLFNVHDLDFRLKLAVAGDGLAKPLHRLLQTVIEDLLLGRNEGWGRSEGELGHQGGQGKRRKVQGRKG